MHSTSKMAKECLEPVGRQGPGGIFKFLASYTEFPFMGDLVCGGGSGAGVP